MISVLALALLATLTPLHARVPGINLGLTNILDGGPLRPKPGFYWQEFLQGYQSNELFDACGEEIPNSPAINRWALASQLFYQFERQGFLGASPGIGFSLPVALSSTISCNRLGLSDSGSGFGDLSLGVYSQWPMIFRNDRPLFVHRLAFNASVPIGKFRRGFTSNPGNGFYFINPYWAATFFYSKRLASSWRLEYLWCAENPKTCLQFGQSIFLNFDFTFQMRRKFWFGLVGYFLQQITDDRLRDVPVPDSKVRVLGLGPGGVYFAPHEFYIFTYFYFETLSRNYPQGFKFVFRFLKHF